MTPSEQAACAKCAKIATAFDESIIQLRLHGVKYVPVHGHMPHQHDNAFFKSTQINQPACRLPGKAHTAHNSAAKTYDIAARIDPDCGGTGSVSSGVRAKTFYDDPVCSPSCSSSHICIRDLSCGSLGTEFRSNRRLELACDNDLETRCRWCCHKYVPDQLYAQCTILGLRTSTGPLDPKKTRVQWMLQDGRFPPWRFPAGLDAPSEAYTTIINSRSPTTTDNETTRNRADDGASSPAKPNVTPGLAQVLQPSALIRTILYLLYDDVPRPEFIRCE